MFAREITLLLPGAMLALGLVACTHTPPGTSVEIALAKRPDVVRMPKPAVAATTSTHPGTGGGSVQPEKTEQVADAFSRGEFCMKTGNDEAAIAAFREAVKIDPKFSPAWNNLAALYEKGGQEKLAMEAFRKSKAQ
jgi:tetratricopeptide (TPR) repeat protein